MQGKKKTCRDIVRAWSQYSGLKKRPVWLSGKEDILAGLVAFHALGTKI